MTPPQEDRRPEMPTRIDEHKGSARKAIIAGYYAAQRLATHPLRGITAGDRTALDHFDAIVRYQPVQL
jgi:hypothetical protein